MKSRLKDHMKDHEKLDKLKDHDKDHDKLKDRKKETLGVGSGIACRMEGEIDDIKSGMLDLPTAGLLLKGRAVQVQAVGAQIGDDKLSFGLARAERKQPGIVDEALAISTKRRVTRGLPRRMSKKS